MSKSLSKRISACKKFDKKSDRKKERHVAKRDWDLYKANAAAKKLKEDGLVVHQTRLMKYGMNTVI